MAPGFFAPNVLDTARSPPHNLRMPVRQLYPEPRRDSAVLRLDPSVVSTQFTRSGRAMSRTILAGLFASWLLSSSATRADADGKTPELKVLDHYVGVWNVEIVSKNPFVKG